MLDSIDALVALSTFGTVSEAATRLRLTQSAVSKRLQVLQNAVGFRLLEPDGRRLRLTAPAVEFLARARPLVAELRGLTHSRAAEPATVGFSLALADSIASSWGPMVIRRALRALPDTRIDLHAHRSILVIESVRLGRYDIGMCTESSTAKDLQQHPLFEEPLVLLHDRLGPKLARRAPLITIESTSATWRAIAPQLREKHPELLAAPPTSVESFGAVVQMVRAGFGNGLVPLGLVRDLRIDPKAYRRLPGITRRIVLITRKTIHEQPGYIALCEQLALAIEQRLSWRK